MKDSDEFKDDFIKNVVKRDNRSLLNNDFEDRIMRKIHSEHNSQNVMNIEKKMSVRFFVLAVILAVALMLNILLEVSILEYHYRIFAIVTLFCICILGIANIENFRRFVD